jgi:hypothetical protein
MNAQPSTYRYFETIDPDGYRRYRRKKRNSDILFLTVFAAAVFCVILAFSHDLFWFAGAGILFVLLNAIAKPSESWDKEAAEENEKCRKEYEIRQKDRELELQEQIAINHTRQTEVLTMISEKEALHVGERIIRITIGAGAKDININTGSGDNLVGAVKKVETYSPELAKALTTIAGALEPVKNEEVQKTFDAMNKKIAGGEDKFTIKALWNQLLSLVPDLTKMTDAAGTIAKFLAK